MPDDRLPIVVLISGRGSNLRSIIQHAQLGQLPVEIRAVISNRADANGLHVAQAAGIPTTVLDHRIFSDRGAFDRALVALIDEYRPRLVVLAGFMRILTPEFVVHFRGRLLNIHPSLLPAFRGLHTHERALQAGVSEHGASVHYVTDELDGGPVFLQATVPVHSDDTASSLADRVLEQEHRLYPLALRLIAEGRIRYDGNSISFDGERMLRPLDMNDMLSGTAQE